MSAKKVTRETRHEVSTTGHQWDGIEELNNPLPRWWLWVFYLTVIWGLGYSLLVPAWPIFPSHATQGLLHDGNNRTAVEKDLAAWHASQKPMQDKLVAADLDAIPKDATLNRYAVNAGKAVFNTYCVQCHQREGAGLQSKGYPTLSDNAWLYGGTMTAIDYTVTHGVRNATDPDARNVGLYMPAWSASAPAGSMKDMASEHLSDTQIGDVVNYVLKISGQPFDAGKATAGAQIFANDCAACHGDNGKGNRDMGAPNLTDAIWLYGGDAATLTRTISDGRGGVMPAWGGRLSNADIRSVAAYVHSLGGGE